MKKEFDLKFKGCTLECIKVDSLNSLIIATYKRDVAEFKAGDILVDDLGQGSTGYISIFKCISEKNDNLFDIYASFNARYNHVINIGESGDEWDNIEDQRLATDEEKQLLFDALKKEGLRWNADKLEIENIKPEFKRGDILASKTSSLILIFDKYTSPNAFSSLINNKDHPMLSNNGWSTPAYRYASAEEIEVFYKDLARMGKKWNAKTLELEKLDISEIVVDYESAIRYLGIKHSLFVRLLWSPQSQDRVDKFNAQNKLQLIAEAWNKFDEFEADWENHDQLKYSPTFKVEDGNIEFSYTSFIREALDFHTSNFSFKTRERAEQFTEQFIDLFKVALGI